MALLDMTFVPRTPSRPMGLFGFAMRAAQLRRQRKALRRLDDTRLSDIGLTRAQAKVESERPFWDMPSSWRR